MMILRHSDFVRHDRIWSTEFDVNWVSTTSSLSRDQKALNGIKFPMFEFEIYVSSGDAQK